MNELMVYALWDAEAGVWVATSEDVPGLATEADTIEQLIASVWPKTLWRGSDLLLPGWLPGEVAVFPLLG